MGFNDPTRRSSDTQDIKDKIDKQRAQHKQKYHLLFETVSDAIYLLSEKGLIIEANQVACTYLDRDKEEVLQLSISDVDKNFSVDQFLSFWDKVPFNTLKQYESIHKTKNGDFLCVEIIGQKFILENTTHYYIVAKDITRHQKAQNAIIESEKRFRNVMENVDTVAVQGYRLDGTTQYWNKASERLYGYTQQEAIGASLLDLIIPSEMRDAVAKEMRKMAESGRPIPSGELSLLHKDGSQVPVISHHAIVKVPGRDPELFCLDIDISDRKQAEAEKEKLQAQLNQAQKMEAVGRLAGGVAHDFNNMLSIILGNLEMLEEDIAPDSPLLSIVHEVQKAAERSADLTRQLLAFARKQMIAPIVLNPNTIIENMLKMLTRLIGEDIDLLWRPNEDLWPVKMDPSQIDQILANLCVNARDAIKGVGKITIETGNFCFDDNYCTVHQGFSPGEFVLICVSDNGNGMDKETMDKLFDPFFTTKKKGKGTGLGLATVYGITKQNKGFINVYSEPGQGSTFKIYIPRYQACQVRQPENAMDKTPKGCETVLLVEDEKAILKMTKTILERLGYTVLPADMPEEAIRICHHYDKKIDLLMTDVVMPSMNGRELVQTIMKIIPGIKYLYMSGYASNVVAHRGVLDDDLNFINKPFSKQELSEKLRDILDDQSD